MLREFPVRSPGVVRRPDAAPTASPRPSASVLLVREGAAGAVEVFTFRRTARMAFAPGMLVFPGGSVDPQDRALTVAGLDERGVAAVRETFEECGVLLAVPDGGTVVGPDLDALRQDLLGGRIDLAAVLHRTGRRLDPALLRPWARWVTPLSEPRRFDTTFYLAALPAGQDVGAVTGEGEDAAWRVPAEVIADHHCGALTLMPPTMVCLEELASAVRVADLLAAARTVRAVRPVVVGGTDGDDEHRVRVDLDGIGGGEPLADPNGPPLAQELAARP